MSESEKTSPPSGSAPAAPRTGEAGAPAAASPGTPPAPPAPAVAAAAKPAAAASARKPRKPRPKAIINENELNPICRVDWDRCTGCTICARDCPWETIDMVYPNQPGIRVLVQNYHLPDYGTRFVPDPQEEEAVA